MPPRRRAAAAHKRLRHPSESDAPAHAPHAAAHTAVAEGSSDSGAHAGHQGSSQNQTASAAAPPRRSGRAAAEAAAAASAAADSPESPPPAKRARKQQQQLQPTQQAAVRAASSREQAAADGVAPSMSRPHTGITQVPASVLAHCIGAALTDEEANQLACTGRHMLHALADYRVKKAVPIEVAATFTQTGGVASTGVGLSSAPPSVRLTSGVPVVRRVGRFGLPVHVELDQPVSEEGSDEEVDDAGNEELASRMLMLPSTVRTIQTSDEFNSDVTQLHWPADLTSLIFGSCFDRPVDQLHLPSGLHSLTLAGDFDQPIAALQLPPHLHSLTFGFDFNQPVEALALPPTLRSLTFGFMFNQPIERLQLPDSLTELTFGGHFNQPLRDWSPPASLTRLTLSSFFDQPATETVLPPSLRSLTLPCDWSIRGVRWPATLRQLTFRRYSQPLLPGDLPSSLTALDLHVYSGPLPDLTLLPHLLSLYMPNSFNESLVGVRWPPSLQRLHFRGEFAQPLPAGSLPDTLTELSLGVPLGNDVRWDVGPGRWNLPVSQLVLPPALRVLRFGDKFNQPVTELRLPETLEVLQFCGISDPSVTRLRLPSGLRELHLGSEFSRSLRSLQVPSRLRLLTFGTPTGGHFPHDAAALPRLPPGAELRFIGG